MAAEVVDAVGVKRDIVRQIEFVHQILQNDATGAVVRDGIAPRHAFGGRVFFVRTDGINVKPSAVHQKSAAARRLEGVIARVHIQKPDALVQKSVIFDRFDNALGRTDAAVIGVGVHHAAELSFQTDNALFHNRLFCGIVLRVLATKFEPQRR